MESPRYAVALAFLLGAIWLAWSGHFTPLLLSFGALSCAIVIAVVLRMKIADRETVPLELVLGLPRYLPWLGWQIVKANVDVARRIIDPRLPIDPGVVRVRALQRKHAARVLFANSITLTPGTVSIDVEGDEIVVHALTREAGEEVLAGEMNRRVARAERED